LPRAASRRSPDCRRVHANRGRDLPPHGATRIDEDREERDDAARRSRLSASIDVVVDPDTQPAQTGIGLDQPGRYAVFVHTPIHNIWV